MLRGKQTLGFFFVVMLFLFSFTFATIEEVDERCGDGITNGEESCDDGEFNDVTCDPEYASSCEYCSDNCEVVAVYSEEHCGDGIIQEGYEACDDGDGMAYDRKYQEYEGCYASYGEVCSYCTDECEEITVEGSQCGDEVLNTLSCANWFYNEEIEWEELEGIATRFSDTSWGIMDNGDCNGEVIDDEISCAVTDGVDFYRCRGTCSDGACQPAGEEETLLRPRPVMYGDGDGDIYESEYDQEYVCLLYKIGYLEHGQKVHPDLRRWLEEYDLAELCADTVLPDEACDDGNERSGDGCSAQCRIEKNKTGGGGGTPSSLLKTGPKDDGIVEETPEEGGESLISACYEDTYILERLAKLLLEDEYIVWSVPADIQPKLGLGVIMNVQKFIKHLAGLDVEVKNDLIRTLVCKIEMIKEARNLRHAHIGYKSGYDHIDYLFQYLQDLAILEFTTGLDEDDDGDSLDTEEVVE